MSKQQRWIALFALIVVVYAAGQYWSQQHSGAFRAVLLDFLPHQVQRIDIQQGQGSPFSLLRQDERWLLSAPQVNEEARIETVDQLLQRLQAIRTEEVISQSEQEWEEYGVAEHQGVVVCLSYEDGNEDCVRIGAYALAENAERVELYTRLQNQREVYVINGLPLSFLDGQIDFFRNRQLLAIPNSLQKLRLRTSQHDLMVQEYTDSSWVDAKGQILDQTYWKAYFEELNSIQGKDFADDIDELALDSFLTWTLTFYSDQDSFELYCYADTSKQKPFILHSDQFPKTWIKSDSSGLVQLVLSPWRKWLSNE